MIVVRLKGGLGNQMFQYALGRVLAIKNNTELVFNIEAYNDQILRPFKGGSMAIRSFDLDVFNIYGRIAKKEEIPFIYRMYGKGKLMLIFDAVRRRIFKHKAQELYAQRFNPKMLKLDGESYIDGFFQSPKYWQGYEDIIRKDFTLKNKLSQNILDLALEIKNTDSLCMHVRRGDFVGNKFHEIVGSDYYQKALNILESKTTIGKIFVFSDDIEWCKDNMKFNYPVFFVDDSYLGVKDEGHLYLMSMCKNFIIPNSTFSWWGSWLSENKNKIVICPKEWNRDTNADMGDLIMDDWIRI